jgi:hypothetical protein
MSNYGYADLDRPIEFESGRIYYPFGGGPFSLTPNRCSVSSLEDGRVNFSLDLYRPALSLPGTEGYAVLEMRLNAQYATDKALSFLRSLQPNAVLSQCALTDWVFRLAPGTVGFNPPPELLAPTQLASNNLGSARMVTRLSADSGLVMKSLLCDNVQPINAIAEAQMKGISPRVNAVVRFRSQELVGEIAGLASAQGAISWQSLVNFFNRDFADLPAEVSGQVDAGRGLAFGEAMADRIIARFGAYLPSAGGASTDPLIQLPGTEDLDDSDIIWSLSQPFLASRRLVMSFDVLSDVRVRMQRLGNDAFIHEHTASALPSLGQSNLMVFCNLPPERVGVAGVGANITFPPKPPNRPQSKSITVQLEPPDDLVQTQVQLAPGETLNYTYSTFAALSNEQGVQEVHGMARYGSGSPLRLTPDDFPVDFALIEVTEELVRLAAINGMCRYRYAGREYSIAFAFDSGRLSSSLALPKGSEAVGATCTARERTSGKQLSLPPFESWPVRLDVSSFPEYGFHEVEFECEFDGVALHYAIEVLPAGMAETFENITILVFTPNQNTRRYGWFASSPFQPGFRYRPHSADSQTGAWEDVSSPVQRLVIAPKQPEVRRVREAFAVSESVKRQPSRAPRKPTSESTEAGENRWPKGIPISPQAEPTDLLLYSLPADPAAKLYIPQYAVDIQLVSGQQRYRISMTDQNEVSSLTVNLVKSPAGAISAAVREAAGNAQEYPHSITITLDFLQAPPSGARKILEFQDITYQGPIVTAKLTFATLQERDEVFRALTEPARDTRLTVKRTIEVAIPQSPLPKVDFSNIQNWVTSAVLPPRPYTAYLKPAFVNVAAVDILVPLNAVNTVNTLDTQPADNLRTMNVVSAAGAVSAIANVNAVGTLAFRTHLSRVESNRFLSPLKPDLIGGTLTGIKYIPVIAHEAMPAPILACTGTETKNVRGSDFAQVNLSVTNWKEFSDDFFEISSDLPPCGKNSNASRTWVDIYDAATDKRLYGFCAFSSSISLAELSFSVPAGQAPPERVYVQVHDRRTNVVRKSNVVETRAAEPPAPQYQVASRELNQAVQPVPFTFPLSLHSYMFQGIVPGSSVSGLVRYRIQSKGKYHTYLQDSAHLDLVYFFPDQFKIARRQEAPFTPFVTVRAASQSGTKDTDVLFDYIIAPYTDPTRLAEARAALLAEPRFGASDVQFQPFITSDVIFFLDRPTEHGSVTEKREGVSLVLQGILKDSLVMKWPDFTVLFDAMYQSTASLFLGRMEIEVPGENKEVIPFSARMDDLVGEMFLYGAEANSDGSLNVSLLNAIESPVQINALDVSLSVNGQVRAAATQGLTLPVRSLAPGSTVSFKVVPQPAQGETGTPEAQFSLRDVRAIPDPEAIWNAILDRSTLEYFRIITVKADSTLFTPVQGREGDQIIVILVEFQGGGTAELTAAQLEAKVRIDYPIDDVILRRSIDETYSYTVTVIRANGRQERDAEPRRKSEQTFHVDVQK